MACSPKKKQKKVASGKKPVNTKKPGKGGNNGK